MRSISLWSAAAVICLLGISLGTRSSDGQAVIVQEGGEGAALEGGGGLGGAIIIEDIGADGGIYAHVFTLQEDNDWTGAKEKLLELAAKGERIPVICALEVVGQSADEKHKTRIASVIASLEQAGSYPLTMEDLAAETKRLEQALAALKGSKTVEKHLPQVLMAIGGACSELDRVRATMCEGE